MTYRETIEKKIKANKAAPGLSLSRDDAQLQFLDNGHAFKVEELEGDEEEFVFRKNRALNWKFHLGTLLGSGALALALWWYTQLKTIECVFLGMAGVTVRTLWGMFIKEYIIVDEAGILIKTGLGKPAAFKWEATTYVFFEKAGISRNFIRIASINQHEHDFPVYFVDDLRTLGQAILIMQKRKGVPLSLYYHKNVWSS